MICISPWRAVQITVTFEMLQGMKSLRLIHFFRVIIHIYCLNNTIDTEEIVLLHMAVFDFETLDVEVVLGEGVALLS